MFYSERIKNILPTDKVLEIGPGATPYYRSDVFLEKIYDTVEELVAQSGHVGIIKTDKPFVTYSGDVFPFKDNEFDYVICSHVLEHVEDADVFLKEVQRVGKKGYLEYPTMYYDYLYNFPEHQLFLMYEDGIINWMKKSETSLADFQEVQAFFYRTFEAGYHDLVSKLSGFFFQGFEWEHQIQTRKVSELKQVTFNSNAQQTISEINNQLRPSLGSRSPVSFKNKVKRRVIDLINKI